MTTFPRATYRSAGLLLLFLALGAFLRVETLTKRPLWHDEIYTLGVVVTAHSLADIWAASGRDRAETPLLYYGAAYAAWHLHRNEKWIRFPACIVGILSIPLLGTLAYRLAGIRAGLLSALLLAITVYHIEYSQDARSYTLLIFWSLTAFHGFLSFLRSRSIAGLLVLTLSVLASLYTHQSAFFVGGAITIAGLAFILRRWWQDGTFPLWLCGGLSSSALVIALGFWPQLAHFRSFLQSDDLDREHTLALTGHFFVELFNRWTFGAPWGMIAVGLLALGVIRSCKSFEPAVILFPWLAIPFLYFGFVPFGKFFDIRFVIAALPSFVILVGSGLSWLSDGAATALARLGRLPDTSRASLNTLMEALCMVFLAGSAVGPYLTFRRLELRCSDFYYRYEVLKQEHGFCRRHLIYASLYRRDSPGMLKKYQPSSKRASDNQRTDSVPH